MMKEVSPIVFHNSTFRLRRVLLLYVFFFCNQTASATRRWSELLRLMSCRSSSAQRLHVNSRHRNINFGEFFCYLCSSTMATKGRGREWCRKISIPHGMKRWYWWCSSWISTVLARSSAAFVSRNACNVEVITLQQFCLRLERRVSGVMIVFISCK